VTDQELREFSLGMRVRRISLGMTHAQLADHVLGQTQTVGRSSINHAELITGGHVAMRHDDVRAAVCDALGMTERELIKLGRRHMT